MIIQGTFKSIDNQKTYFVKIGNTGFTKEIQDSADTTVSNTIVCFDKSPVEISCDMEDTFDNVYIRECSINLISNFDIRQYVVASNYTDIPVEIRYNNASGTILFTGFVIPLSFKQPFALEWNKFTLNCVDKLGILEYIKFPPLLNNDFNYNTPRYFMNLALSQCGFTSIAYNIEYDHTQDTKINPSIFIGESEDDWLNCKEVLEEIGKIYGCWYWQDGDICKVENIMLPDLTSSTLVTKNDVAGKDANISVSECYNQVKCTVDISSVDEEILDPFKEDYLAPVTEKQERILTELAYEAPNTKMIGYYYQVAPGAYATNGFVGYCYSARLRKGWSTESVVGTVEDKLTVYDHYCQIKRSTLFDFGNDSYLNNAGTTNPSSTLGWLYANPGNGAFISIGKTDNLWQTKNKGAVNLPSLKDYLVIQVGGHGVDDTEEASRLSNQIQAKMNAGGICSYTMDSVINMVPNDVSTTNYILISGNITLNPIQPKTGPNWGDDDYSRSTNTISDCISVWDQIDWHTPYIYAYDQTLSGYTVDVEDKKCYYQNYTWTTFPESFNDQWPYNQNPVLGSSIASPILGTKRKLFKYIGSGYTKSGQAIADDYISKIPILACELKIGNKYLIEDFDVEKQYTGYVPTWVYRQIYKWCTLEQCPEVNGQKQTWFTLGIDPQIDDYIIGNSVAIQNTVTPEMGLLDKTGFAIPISGSDKLNGQLTFKILGPYNSTFDDVSKQWHWNWFFWNYNTTEHTPRYILAHTENIYIEGLKFELASDNARKQQLNDDNDLVYYSEVNDTYIEDKDFDCKFCTSLTTQEVNDLGIDYNLNNSAILTMSNTPWYGMTYEGVANVKLEEARVAEQYNMWKKPRNTIELTMKLTEPDKNNYKQNYTFNYVTGTYRITSREIKLKHDTMKCTMKDLS